ncbi:hypothetical protein [Pseudooceanicola sp. LIPI14-2-Ac024]|uniref:hypothetical protein n=1 Tax=Pseudooceanicola sp. LIPI14-2-Ac024 TaxID=3344875 RepID=UPI0035D01DB5
MSHWVVQVKDLQAGDVVIFWDANRQADQKRGVVQNIPSPTTTAGEVVVPVAISGNTEMLTDLGDRQLVVERIPRTPIFPKLANPGGFIDPSYWRL